MGIEYGTQGRVPPVWVHTDAQKGGAGRTEGDLGLKELRRGRKGERCGSRRRGFIVVEETGSS